MAYILPNWKELKREKWQKNKISPTKIATVHRKLLAILFDIEEISVARQFASMKLSLKNPYHVREYIERKMEYNKWELGSRWKTTHNIKKEEHERMMQRAETKDRKKRVIRKLRKDNREEYTVA